jgi:hypothetical protein
MRSATSQSRDPLPPVNEVPLTRAVGSFVLLAAAAWFVLPGMSVAVIWYGSALISERLFLQYRASAGIVQRSLVLIALALVWLLVLTWSALVLPSNLGRVI